MHFRRGRIHGDPLITATRAKRTLVNDLRAAAYATTDECVFLDGYAIRPSVPFEGKIMFASRVVWIIRHGDPGEAHVLHRCNGGSGAHGCINIRHLYLGDKAQNRLDAVQAGRLVIKPRRGEECTSAVLTERQVRTIRERWAARDVTQKALAAEHGVSRALLSMIVNGKRWAHLS
ncbi:hypothetical protein ACFYOF_20865 [Streptomyces sp. NPDC007148]|uniref:hypothetical protein n=1 Tax=Streptomyces sp. NPDC007148 TaxID=3364775 RepID=UPI00368342E9